VLAEAIEGSQKHSYIQEQDDLGEIKIQGGTQQKYKGQSQ
jgi:hypothetical protein